MCFVKEEFKLCTCSTVAPENADWILFHRQEEQINVVVGRLIMRFSDDVFADMENELNSRACFGNELIAMEGDILSFRTGESNLEYEFKNGLWRKSNAINAYRTSVFQQESPSLFENYA